VSATIYTPDVKYQTLSGEDLAKFKNTISGFLNKAKNILGGLSKAFSSSSTSSNASSNEAEIREQVIKSLGLTNDQLNWSSAKFVINSMVQNYNTESGIFYEIVDANTVKRMPGGKYYFIDTNGNLKQDDYLNDIQDVMDNRMDGNKAGKKDGKVSYEEAYNDLDIPDLFDGLQEGSDEYNKLKTLTDKIPEALKKYIGSDGQLQAEEWSKFLNGPEWGAVLDQFHSSSNWASFQMSWIKISNEMDRNVDVTKDIVTKGLLSNLKKNYSSDNQFNSVSNRLKALVEKYAGKDGVFTVKEYTAMLNDSEYKQLIDKYHLTPYNPDYKYEE
ncbi:hypothetical protein II906_10590, partial [bacterium]|nr:hypothetical protein [bacterium]